ncbi:Phosphotyrosyl phosphatase activator, partial [Ascodesmis nigricans]
MAATSPLPADSALLPITPTSIAYFRPKKRIFSHSDLAHFPSTPAYELLTSFLAHLSASVTPLSPHTGHLRPPSDFYTNNPKLFITEPAEKIINLISDLSALTEQAPPIVGPRRFGNPAFRSWHTLASKHILEKLKNYVPQSCEPALVELEHYLIASLGSAQRLDYGTGHELDFTAFLAGLWKLGVLGSGDEMAIVLKIYDAYFELVRKLVLTYNLEPAGSHGVWGLDDHAFLPYIFGSAQLTTYLPSLTPPEAKGDYAILNELPKPKDVVSKEISTNWTDKNLYFGAINFIHRVKSGPFWEHSPILFDISGVQKGWGKVNEGLRKMYEKEVLGKFPVVQHFWFGGLFEWN